jgi:hypothetical protein
MNTNKTANSNKEPFYRRDNDEPLIDAQAINLQWGKTWPRVIARAWYIEGLGKNASEADTEWLRKLLSGNKQEVRTALQEEGFAPRIKKYQRVDSKTTNVEDDFQWFWDFSHIVVKKAEDGAKIVKREGNKDIQILATGDPKITKYEYQDPITEIIDGNPTITQKNGWFNDKRLAPTLILTLPPKPKSAEHIALAITDYEAKGLVYPFSFCC